MYVQICDSDDNRGTKQISGSRKKLVNPPVPEGVIFWVHLSFDGHWTIEFCFP